jgi:hypothetical protein
MLSHEEYVEQAYLFRVLYERMGSDTPIQDLLTQTKLELLATTKLPMAVDFLVAELKHHGIMTEGMRRLSHYFTPFQTFVVSESETDRGRFEFRTAVKILQAEAEYRSKSDSRQGLFFFHFETLCRNRLNYDRGLKAMSEDPAYDAAWKEWILVVRRQLGLIDLADLIYGRSEEFVAYRKKRLGPDAEAPAAILFGSKEGKIAFANRRKDPLHLFAAMQRHLGYPIVPRMEVFDENQQLIPQLQRRIERMELRIKLLEEEQRQGIDISKFFSGPNGPRVELPPED